jgi:hypothetical protein
VRETLRLSLELVISIILFDFLQMDDFVLLPLFDGEVEVGVFEDDQGEGETDLHSEIQSFHSSPTQQIGTQCFLCFSLF